MICLFVRPQHHSEAHLLHERLTLPVLLEILSSDVFARLDFNDDQFLASQLDEKIRISLLIAIVRQVEWLELEPSDKTDATKVLKIERGCVLVPTLAKPMAAHMVDDAASHRWP